LNDISYTQDQPQTDNPTTLVNACILRSRNATGEVHKNTDAAKPRNCTGEHENKFTGQSDNFLGGTYPATLIVLFARAQTYLYNKLAANACESVAE
jgi:hypothetical protein